MVVGLAQEEQPAPPVYNDFVGQLVAFFNQTVHRTMESDQTNEGALLFFENLAPIMGFYFKGVSLLLAVSMVYEWQTPCDSYIRFAAAFLAVSCLIFGSNNLRLYMHDINSLYLGRLADAWSTKGLLIGTLSSFWYIYSPSSCTLTRVAFMTYITSFMVIFLVGIALGGAIVMNPSPGPFVSNIVAYFGLEVLVRAAKPLRDMLERYQIKED